MNSILGMEPILAFFYLHVICLATIILLSILSRVKKLAEYSTFFSKTSYLIFLLYFALHAFCICTIFLSLFVSFIPTIAWFVLYLKLCIALGFFAFFLMVIGCFLLPFGMFTLILSLIKNTLK